MKLKKGIRLVGVPFLLVLSLCVSCKDPDDTGLSVLPPGDSVHAFFIDTVTIHGKTYQLDSLFTENTPFSMVGNYYDEEFGRVSASTWTQFHTTGDNIVFGDSANLTLDSLVLTLNLEGYYGRYDDPMTLEIYEITENFPANDTLESIDSIAVGGVDYANGFTINFAGQSNPNDVLRIHLDALLGNKLLFAPTDSLINNATFSSFFKGLHIRSKTVGFNSREPGGIFAFDLLSSESGLTLYYKDIGTAKSYTFNIDEDSRRFHNFHRGDYSTKLLAQVVADSSNPSPVNFMVQAGALVKFFVDMPYLEQLSPVGVNRAELVLQVDETLLGSDDRFSPPARIFVFRADSTGKRERGIPKVADYDPATHSYSVDLTSFAMAMINGVVENNGLLIIPDDINITVNRAVIGGPGHATLAPRLKLVYTNVPH